MWNTRESPGISDSYHKPLNDVNYHYSPRFARWGIFWERCSSLSRRHHAAIGSVGWRINSPPQRQTAPMFWECCEWGWDGRWVGGRVGRDQSRRARGGHGCSARTSPPGLFVNRARQTPVLLLGRDMKPRYDSCEPAFALVWPPEGDAPPQPTGSGMLSATIAMILTASAMLVIALATR